MAFNRIELETVCLFSSCALRIIFRGLLCIVMGCLFLVADVSAQGNYQQTNPPRKKSALEKLSDLNRKVKRSIRESLFGEDEQDQPKSSSYRQDARRQSQPERYAQGDYRATRAPQNTDPYRRPAATQAQYQQEVDLSPALQPEYDSRTRSDYPDPRNTTPRDYRPPNGYPAMDMRAQQQPQYDAGQEYARQQPMQATPRAPQGEHYGARSGMPELARPQPNWGGGVPAPLYQHPPVTYQQPVNSVATQAASQNQNGEYRAGHYQNVDGLTQQQLDQQETATQKAMRLYAENQSLLENQQALAIENKLLREQLMQKKKLLEEIESAIENARNELQMADQQNTKLKKQVVQLEAEKEQQLLASNRQLNSIRKKLDDVLMIEMTRE